MKAELTTLDELIKGRGPDKVPRKKKTFGPADPYWNQEAVRERALGKKTWHGGEKFSPESLKTKEGQRRYNKWRGEMHAGSKFDAEAKTHMAMMKGRGPDKVPRKKRSGSRNVAIGRTAFWGNTSSMEFKTPSAAKKFIAGKRYLKPKFKE